jgi:glycerol kinase
MNTGETPVRSENGLLTTIAWGLNGKVNYALEGSVFVCGAAIQWLRDELDIVKDAPASEAMALSVEDTAGVYVVPAFVGLGAPYWDPYARGAILGLTRGANRKHIVRATLDSMAYQCCDLLDAMNRDVAGITGTKVAGADITGLSPGAAAGLTALKVDGGACANNYLMQFQADMLDCPVLRPACIETTSLGAAYLAGLATGYFRDLEDVKANWQVDRIFVPAVEDSVRASNLAGWHKAVDRSLGWDR